MQKNKILILYLMIAIFLKLKTQSSYMLWYESIISYLKDNGYEFISFIDAIKELEYSSKESL